MIQLNIKEAKALIKKYRSITLEDIKHSATMYNYGHNETSISRTLTGFGSTYTCKLCRTTNGLYLNCVTCIYYGEGDYGCLNGVNNKTYRNIHMAKTPITLRNAFRKRADHIEKILKQIKKEENGK